LKKTLLIFALACASFFVSCRKDKLITSPGAKLDFAQDSVLFDTVFTKIGSTTKLFTVRNKNKGTVNISSLRLARGSASFYRLNVDGLSGKSFTDIEIPANDSIYIFVEVTIDPSFDPSISPFIYRDSIVFETNGNLQDVDLISFGQNAYYHMPTSKILFSNTQALYYSLDTNVYGAATVTWKNDKPHLIYGYLVVDSAHSLIIPAGTKIYVHNSGGLWVYKYGNIQVNGVLNSPVTFQGDRLEPEYKDVPGQWDRIWINEGSNNNVINYAVIKNAFIGVHAGYSVLDGYGGSVIDVNAKKRLWLTNTIIQNCSFAGILAHYYNINGGNDIISNCGKYLGVFQYGGSYQFYHCTFANYWNQSNNSGTPQSRTTPSFYFNNYVDGLDLALDSAWFGNCIMVGSLAEEFQFDTTATPGFVGKLKFDYCMLRTQLNTSSPSHFQGLVNYAPAFVNAAAYDFHLGPNSSAENTGSGTYGSQWPIDLDGQVRLAPYDMGAYNK
jgi:hypothetical protein